jgi:hypothetical protein
VFGGEFSQHRPQVQLLGEPEPLCKKVFGNLEHRLKVALNVVISEDVCFAERQVTRRKEHRAQCARMVQHERELGIVRSQEGAIPEPYPEVMLQELGKQTLEDCNTGPNRRSRGVRSGEPRHLVTSSLPYEVIGFLRRWFTSSQSYSISSFTFFFHSVTFIWRDPARQPDWKLRGTGFGAFGVGEIPASLHSSREPLHGLCRFRACPLSLDNPALELFPAAGT